MKKTIKLTENDIHEIVKKSVEKVMEEGIGDRLSGMWQGFKQGADAMNTAQRDAQDYNNLRNGAGAPKDRFNSQLMANRDNYNLGTKNISLAYRNISNAVNCLKQVNSEDIRGIVDQLTSIGNQLNMISMRNYHKTRTQWQ